MSVPNLVGHRLVALGSALVELMDIKRPSIWRDLALAKVVALKEREQHWGPTIDTVEVSVLKGWLEVDPHNTVQCNGTLHLINFCR